MKLNPNHSLYAYWTIVRSEMDETTEAVYENNLNQIISTAGGTASKSMRRLHEVWEMIRGGEF